MNICQTGFMENMPSCDLKNGVSSSSSYKPTVLGGKSACVVASGTFIASITPLVCSTPSVIDSNPSNYIEGCGLLNAGIYYTGNTNAPFVSISPANTLYSLFDFFF
jgi:hypothetical protein